MINEEKTKKELLLKENPLSIAKENLKQKQEAKETKKKTVVPKQQQMWFAS